MFLGFAVTAVAALVRWYGSGDRAVRRLVNAAPGREFGSVEEGEWVRVTGRARVEKPLRAPLTDRPCVCWQVIVWQLAQPQKVLLDECVGSDFAIVNTAGVTARVEADDLRGRLRNEQVFYCGPSQVPPPHIEAFLAGHGIAVRGPSLYRRLECRERVCFENEVLEVVGEGHWEQDPEEGAHAGDGYREARFATRLVICARKDRAVLVSNDRSVGR